MRELLLLFIVMAMILTKYHFGLLVSTLILDTFKDVKISNFICHYRANKKAWMTGLLFEGFVYSFDKRMNGSKYLFFVDNCLAHPQVI